MKGNDKLIEVLNQLLADELTAISQYMVHSEMCDNWGYEKLHKAIEHQAMDEMHHAEWLIQRIIFFEGTPIVSKLNPMKIGKSVLEMVTLDQADELDAIHAYNAAIRLAHDVADEATADLLRKILLMEEGHVDWAEQQSDQIEQMGLANYLVNQTHGAAGEIARAAEKTVTPVALGYSAVIHKKELTPMNIKTNQTKRSSQSWRKHVRRMKQDARKTGIAYTANRPVVSTPAVSKK